MKTLKLEVGKTYRNRKGEEVLIIGNNIKGKYPYQGDNGYWYTKNGRWYDFDEEDSENLIEEVPEPTRHTFDIPDGVKKITILQEGNMNKIKELTDFYMWMQENDYDHNIRARVERKAKIYLSSINAEQKLPKYSAEYTRGYKDGWRDCCKDVKEFG